jgi:uncharacterized lipoprotein YajG
MKRVAVLAAVLAVAACKGKEASVDTIPKSMPPAAAAAMDTNMKKMDTAMKMADTAMKKMDTAMKKMTPPPAPAKKP